MKPVYANYFISTVNNNGECVLSVIHTYPNLGVDVQGSEVNSEQVASLVMTQADARILAEVLNTTLDRVDAPMKLEINSTNLGGH